MWLCENGGAASTKNGVSGVDVRSNDGWTPLSEVIRTVCARYTKSCNSERVFKGAFAGCAVPIDQAVCKPVSTKQLG
jgi:hypothetical protein